jgi:hypothetical protein
MSVKNKLEAMGIIVNEDSSDPEHVRDFFFTKEGSRLIVGPVTSVAVTKDGGPARLGSTANLTQDELKNLSKLPGSHPFKTACEIAMQTAVVSLDFAVTGAGGLNKLKRCLRVDLSVAATPNFERSGLIGARVANFFIATFGVEFRPIVATTCVAANPRGALFSMTAEYVMEPVRA